MRRLKIYAEIFGVALFVFGGTFFLYRYLASDTEFWSTQFIWSSILAICWVVVAAGYYHQGAIIHHDHNAEHVSVVLPIAVFVVQIILFIKGIYYNDWSLIWGAVVVNSGVLFSLYQIMAFRRRHQNLPKL